MLNRLINIILNWIIFNIIKPIQAFWHYYINHSAIEDTPRNRERYEYLTKIAEDSSYQPRTYAEHSFEKELYDAYCKGVSQNEKIILDAYGEIPSYEEVRSECAMELILHLSSYYWVDNDEDDWEEE